MSGLRHAAAAALLGAFVPVLLHGQSVPQATPASWLQLRGDATNAGFIPGSLEVSWRFKAPRPVRGLAVADGVVLLGTESADADALPDRFAPDQRGFLAALDAATGRKLWSRPVTSWIHGDPVIHDGIAVASFGRWPMQHPGGALAVELRTGRALWSLTTESGLMPSPGLDTAHGTVLAAGGDGVLYQIALRNGAVLGMTGLQAADAMSSPRLPGDGTFYLGSADVLRAYSTATGARRWEYHARTMRAVGDVPVGVSDSIVLTTGTMPIGFWHAARLLPVGRFVQLAREAARTHKLSSYRSWFAQQWLIALDRRTGKLAWQRPLGIGLEVPRNTAGTPVVDGSIVVVSSPVSRVLWAFEIATGRPIWRRRLPAMHKGALTIVDDALLYGDKAGRIRFLRVASGEPLGECHAGSGFSVFAPVVVGRTLFAATKDGWLYAAPYAVVRDRAIEEPGSACFGDGPAS